MCILYCKYFKSLATAAKHRK